MRRLVLAALAVLAVLVVGGLTPVQAADKPKDLIIGKWQPAGEEAKEVVIEFLKDGKLKLMLGKDLNLEGTYKFLDDNNIELEMSFMGQTRKTKMSVKVTKDELITKEEGKDKEEKLKRVK